jgi:hypothetical protein
MERVLRTIFFRRMIIILVDAGVTRKVACRSLRGTLRELSVVL